MPEGVDAGGGRRADESGGVGGINDVLVAEGDAQAADDQAREAGNDGESDALLKGIGGHEFEFSLERMAGQDWNGRAARLDIV